MNYIKNKKKFLSLNFQALKFIRNLDIRFLFNIIVLSIFNIIKDWYIFLVLFIFKNISLTKTRIVLVFVIFFLIEAIIDTFNIFKKRDNNLLRNKYNNILSKKMIELSKDIADNPRIVGLSQVLNDYQQYNGGPIIFFYRNLEMIFQTIIIFVIAIILLVLFLSNELLIIAIIFGIFQIIVKEFLNKKLKKIDDDNFSNQKVLTKGNRLGEFYFSLLSSEFSKMKSIRNNNTNKFIEKKYSEFLRPTIDSLKKYQVKRTKIKIFSYTTVIFNIIAIFIISLIVKNNIDIKVVFMLSNIFLALENLLSISYDIEDNTRRIEEFFEFLEISPKLKEHQREEMEDEEIIKLNNLTFSYDKIDNVLENINLTFSKNKIYSIVGENGQGKSTLIKIILNLLESKNGMIRINQNLGENYLSYNLSDNEIFSFTIGENITLKDKLNQKDQEYIEKLSKDLNFLKNDKDISKIKLGNDYGLVGRDLSGGQVKKMIFQRLIYYDREIIILDEPISYLDIDSEKEIYDSIKKLSKGKVLIIISHRLASCLISDEIIVLKDKKIYARGDHTSLYKENSYYKKLFDSSKKLTQ